MKLSTTAADLTHATASAARAASLCAGHAQQLGGVSPSTQPDGGEGLAKRKGYRREARSGGSVRQKSAEGVVGHVVGKASEALQGRKVEKQIGRAGNGG